MEWIEEANKEEDVQNKLLSFYDYTEIFNKNPLKECRPTNKQISHRHA